jgi:hypothetical protein
MIVHLYRVTVRGQFERLSADHSRILTDHAARHDVMAAAYTQRGTFGYDQAPCRSASRRDARFPGGSPLIPHACYPW